MATPIAITNENPTSARVSVAARLVPAVAFIIVAAGAVLSALYIRNTFLAMRNAETAGVAAVAEGLAGSNLFMLIALYVAIVCGFIGILLFVARLFMETKTVAPSAWFFVFITAVGLLPTALLWTAESMTIDAVIRRTGIMPSASTINLLLILSMSAAPLSILLILGGSVWPLSSASRRKWGPLVALVVMVLVLIVIAITFQVRTLWLYQAKELERF